ncbi:hypothetical protein G3I51_21815, partial [Streptomyces sp. SID9944]|nr:hypothetical protein [Streptomyces sp. SID9944]
AVSVSVAGTGGAGHADGRLTVAAASTGDTTLVTLTASGPAEVHWTAAADAPWLYLSRSAGTLRPGETVTVKVYVDHLREPSGHWSARVTIAPARTVVTIDGYGTAPTPSVTAPADPPPSGDPHPTPTATTSPDPSQSPPTTSPSPTPPPTDPPPTTPDSPPPTTPENSTAPSPSNS